MFRFYKLIYLGNSNTESRATTELKQLYNLSLWITNNFRTVLTHVINAPLNATIVLLPA